MSPALAFVLGFALGVVTLLAALSWLAAQDDRRTQDREHYDPHDAPDWSRVTVPLAMPEELPRENAILEPPYPPGSRLVRDDHPFDL